MKVIQRGAFEGCSCLTEVFFAGNSQLQIIGESSFRGCGFGRFAVPAHVRKIMAHAFQDCKNLATVTLSQELETLGEDCFGGSALEYAMIPRSVREIASEAFYGCRNMHYLVIEEGSQLRQVGLLAFGQTPLDICDV